MRTDAPLRAPEFAGGRADWRCVAVTIIRDLWKVGRKFSTEGCGLTDIPFGRLAVKLISESRLYGHALAALGAATRQHGLAAGGLHPLTEAVGLAAAPAVGLKCAFWHCGSALPTEK